MAGLSTPKLHLYQDDMVAVQQTPPRSSTPQPMGGWDGLTPPMVTSTPLRGGRQVQPVTASGGL